MTNLIGLRDYQVVQRDSPTSAQVRLSGSARLDFVLTVHDAEHATLHEQRVAGNWTVDLVLPVGGPYEVWGEGERLVRDVLVGDLWILAGQSNMEGAGILHPELEAPLDLVHAFDLTRTWRLAEEPLHRWYDSPDLAHHGIEDREERAAAKLAYQATGIGAGLGVAFGNALVEATGVPVGLVLAAKGGSLLEQWSPARRAEGGASLFGSLALALETVGGRVAGMLWYQGESEALTLVERAFSDRLQNFVEAVRLEVSHPDLPVFHVQIGRVIPLALSADVPLGPLINAWNAVREAQRNVDLGPGAMTSATDLGLSDVIHLSWRSLRRLGRRLALLACGAAGTIEVAKVELEFLSTASYEVRVTFTGVSGELHPIEHAAGFSIRGADGAERAGIYQVEVINFTQVAVRCVGVPADGDALWYGYGLDPYCTLVDESDMPVPCFGPLPLVAPERPPVVRDATHESAEGSE